MKNNRNVLLLILDGWGKAEKNDANPVHFVKTPFFDSLEKRGGALLVNNGPAVGLPPGQMGNSEVGHLNIGAGRRILQDLEKINEDIEEGKFFSQPLLVEVMQKAEHAALHLFGLVSDGGVHSSQEHLYALLEMAKKYKVKKVYIHCFLDGRDVPPTSGKGYVKQLENKIKEIGVGCIATVMGRFYAMDRDKRWERIKEAYQVIAEAEGKHAESPIPAITSSYEAGENDEFVYPVVVDKEYQGVQENDTILFYNFRPDRARELTEAFTSEDFPHFQRKKFCRVHFYCMTEYDKRFGLPVVYRKEFPRNTLGEVVSRHGLKQLRIAETEKYAHVTFFFNGGVEQAYQGEDRKLIPSPKVATYDLQPEMSAYEVTDNLVQELTSQKYSLIVCNYANPDMVGHTGVWEAALKAVSVMEECVSRVVQVAMDNHYSIFISADHGNIEVMFDEKKNPVTSHSMSKTPLYYFGKKRLIKKEGALKDIAPSVLFEMGLDIPEEMTGNVMIG